MPVSVAFTGIWGSTTMSERRRSVHLAAAVSSILSAPAIAVGAGIAIALLAPSVFAQETTSQLTGYVVGADGQPIAGAAVTFEHLTSGLQSRSKIGTCVQFSATGLRVG